MKGIESNGMILMAETTEGKLVFIQPAQPIDPGAIVS
jgi:methionyl-tRNA synthetase